MTTRGLPTCGSRILQGWVPPYDATLVTRLREGRPPILGKTNMDEFAMGSSTEHSAYGPSRNPWDLDRIPGGPGGGSSSVVASFQAPLAIGTDTGGSIRQPAAVTGTVGTKPTYGGVPLRPRGAGVVARPGRAVHPHRARRRPPPRGDRRPRPDGLHLDRRPRPACPRGRPPRRRLRDADRDRPRADRRLPGRRAGALRRGGPAPRGRGAEVVEVSCPSFTYALAAYYLILPSEASSNLAKFDAMRYGLRVARRHRRAQRRAGHGRHPRRRLR